MRGRYGNMYSEARFLWNAPVREDSRMPKGAINFRKESIRVGFADLANTSYR
jgi:hypothetical protein